MPARVTVRAYASVWRSPGTPRISQSVITVARSSYSTRGPNQSGRITTGWLARHTPQGPGGRQAALIDIAQDLLLAQLCQQGMFDHPVFKGGTALRKLYAGNAGRFSTDLDFSVRNPDDDPEAVAGLLRDEIDGQDIDGFRYFVEDHRGRAQVRYEPRSVASAT
jgi:Nucleotidyl transferase AbiEii toxin, Type IV TA system